MSSDIYVTQPSLPELSDFIPYLEKIWTNKILTNGGPFHQQLEVELAKYLGVEYISLFANGTLALVTALQALGIKGEVITTPYSFVATAHSLLWNRLKPVFVDIDPYSLNINPKLLESAITESTSAILPVHVYGRPCAVCEIEEIASKYNLRVIYDAAHAFGVRINGQSILKHGDLSILSFHATKVFNTFEGGAIVSNSSSMKHHIDHLKNFGFENELTVVEAGINGKLSEFNAALGLAQILRVDSYIDSRCRIDSYYRKALSCVPGITCLELADGATNNYGYFPILVNENYRIKRDELYEKLKNNHINSRRYFYPLISQFPMYAQLPTSNVLNLPIATDIANRVLCLPIYPSLQQNDLENIVDIIRG